MMDIGMKVQILRACSSKKGNRCSSCPAFGHGDRNCIRNAMKDAATALSTLQAENEKLRAELEQVKRERDSAILFAQCYTEKVDNPCTVCRHRFNEVGAPLKKRCENCGLTGTPECGWEFDFNWDLKED